jgi:hypothetical protein
VAGVARMGRACVAGQAIKEAVAEKPAGRFVIHSRTAWWHRVKG